MSEASLQRKRSLRAVPVSRTSAPAGLPIENKLHAPSLRKEWVERRELINALTGTAAKLVLIEAPAGYGKTILATQWQASTSEDRPFAWVSLDPDDDDPGRLWWHIVHAFLRACPGLDGDKMLRAIRVPIPDITGTVMPLLLHELAVLGTPVVLILDDYQVIQERSCHEQVAFLLLHLPPGTKIALITRTEPRLPLGRLRAAGEIVEIRTPDLRFAPAEAAALVHDVSGVELAGPDLDLLLERTEGWPAGLHLAALFLGRHPSPSSYISQFTGDNRFIADFLAGEVLSRQPNDIRQFLARTAILARFCAPLCDAVAGSVNAAEIIDVLERENLFLVPLDDNRQWYRYHQLFAQVLRGQLARTEPDIRPTLHQRASAWHLAFGSTDEAIGHALAARDIAGAVDLVARHWLGYVESGQAATVRSWIRSLNDDQIAAHPMAAHSAAWVAAFLGDGESVRRWVPVIRAAEHDGSLPDGMRSLESSAALLGGTFGFDGIRAMRESAARAVELETDPMSPWYALALTGLGFSLFLTGEPGAAEPLRKATMSDTCGPMVRMMALSAASLVATEEGGLGQAMELASAARRVADDGDLGHAPQTSLIHTATGAVHVLEGRLEEARTAFKRALRSGKRCRGLSPWPTLETLLRLASVLLDLGDRPGAVPLIDEARDILTSLPDGAQVQLARLERLEHRIAAGQPRVISLADPLTEREVEVLRMFQGTLSLHEIGQELHLSRNTIKTHARAIYRKLGVRTRDAAVERGRMAGDW